MKTLDLEFNDYVTNIFIFTIKDGESQYFFSDKTDWFMDGWPYVYTETKDCISEALTALKTDVIPLKQIKEIFKQLHLQNKSDIIELNLPMLYIDFDKKILKSMYHEQNLADKVMEEWTAVDEDFLSEIPQEYRYWQFEESP